MNSRTGHSTMPAEGGTAEPTPLLLARVPLSVRWRDLDAFKHVNNANFLTYLEEARLVWLSGIEGPWFGATWMPVLAATNVNYRTQIEWPAEIVVELYCQRIGQSSVTVAHRIVSAADPGHLHSDGNVVMVWIEPASGRSVALPETIRKACG